MWEGSVWLAARGMEAGTPDSMEITPLEGRMQSELSPHWVIQSGEQVMQRLDPSAIPGGKGGHQERLTDKQWALEMPPTFL